MFLAFFVANPVVMYILQITDVMVLETYAQCSCTEKPIAHDASSYTILVLRVS